MFLLSHLINSMHPYLISVFFYLTYCITFEWSKFIIFFHMRWNVTWTCFNKLHPSSCSCMSINILSLLRSIISQQTLVMPGFQTSKMLEGQPQFHLGLMFLEGMTWTLPLDVKPTHSSGEVNTSKRIFIRHNRATQYKHQIAQVNGSLCRIQEKRHGKQMKQRPTGTE